MDHSEVQRGKFYRAVVDGRECDVLVDQKLQDGRRVMYELVALPTGRRIVTGDEVQFLYERKEVAADGGPVMSDDELDDALAGLFVHGLVERQDPAGN
jgi:hypothetical protein